MRVQGMRAWLCPPPSFTFSNMAVTTDALTMTTSSWKQTLPKGSFGLWIQPVDATDWLETDVLH